MHGREYLIKRGMRYSFRIKVPTHLHLLLGRIEIRRSLGTANYSKARMQSQRMAWMTKRLFKAMTNTKIVLTSQQISDHLDIWYEQMMERDSEIAKQMEQGLWKHPKADYQQSLDEVGFQFVELLEGIVDRGREQDRPDWDQPRIPNDRERKEALTRAVGFMEWMGEEDDTVSVLSGLPSLEELEETQKRELIIAWLMKAVKVYSDKQLQQLGVVSGTTRLKPKLELEPENVPSSATEILLPPKPLKSITEAWSKYAEEKARPGSAWNPSPPILAQQALREFLSLQGDVQPHAVTRDDMMLFRKLQEVMPSGNIRKYQSMTPQEILEVGDDIPEDVRRKGLRPSQIMGYISSLFEWLEEEEYIHKSPAKGIKVGIRKGAKVQIWEKEELTKLFDEGNLNELAGIAKQDAACSALPLVMTLLLYTGARLNEICYLRSQDFSLNDQYSESSFPVLMITPVNDRGLKSEQSARKVPLHPDLVEVGIAEYFHQRQVSRHQYLMDIPAKGGKRGKSMTQSFGKYRDNLGFPSDRTKHLHSLRHTFINQYTGVMEDADKKRMTGHALGSVHDKTYASRLDRQPQDRTHADLSKITSGLDLSSLRLVLERFVPGYPRSV